MPTQKELAERVARHLNGTASKSQTGGLRHVLKSTASVVDFSGQGKLKIKATDGQTDYEGDCFVQRGIDWSDYLRNPVVPFNHDPSCIIGRGMNPQYDAGQDCWFLDIQMALGLTQKADEAWRLIKGGFIKGWSVGAVILDAEPIDKSRPWAGQRFLKSKIVEVSCAPIPANPRAVTQEIKSMKTGSGALSKAERLRIARELATPPALKVGEIEAIAHGAVKSRAERIAEAEALRYPPGAVVRELAPANTAQGFAERMNLHQLGVQGAASKAGHYTREERQAIARQIIAESNRI